MMLEDAAAQPLASMPEAARSPAALKGGYRCLDNESVCPQGVLASHALAVWERMREGMAEGSQLQQVVLAVSDTTSLNHSSHPATSGLGNIGQGQSSAQGFFLHSVVAFSEQGAASVCLGVLVAQMWARPPRPLGLKARSADKNSRPLAQRESQRWTLAYEAVVAQRVAQLAVGPQVVWPRLIYVADREADIYELFLSNLVHDAQCGVLVRAKHERRLAEGGQVVWEALAQQPELGRLSLGLPQRASQAARVATLALRSAPVVLRVPVDKARLFGATQVLSLWALEVVEVAAPAGAVPLHWKLLSSTPVPDLAAAMRQVGWYAQRWNIEVFHRTLKSGCRAEARQLQSFEQLTRALVLDLIVAWRILALRDASRHTPEAAASRWLDPAQCAVLTAWATRGSPTQVPPPSIAQAVGWIARLGGYLHRKHDPPPGAQVLWRGLSKLTTMTETWILAQLVGKS